MTDNQFSMKPCSIQEGEQQQKEFVRDESDNKLFPEIQVKDIREIITDDCIGHFDFDTTIWKSCANMETKYIIVKHKTEGWEEEFANKSTFKGLGKGIKKDSWLGMKNIERDVEGLEAYSLDDFEIIDCARLKMDHDKAIEQAKIQIHMKLKQVKQQYRVPNIIVHIGAGDCFRHNLDLCRLYKGQREGRPIILKEIRDWVANNLNCEVTKEGWEADDRVEHYGYQGYINYRRYKKFNHLVIASDKDAKNNPKLLIDPDTYVGENNPLKGKFKFPQAMLIEATDVSSGDIGIIQKEKSTDYKFYGFKGLLWQAFCSGDGADNYNCLTHLQQNLNFGDESAYRLLKPCKTAREALQAVVDKFAELLPYGVQYQNHKGEYLDVTTIEYMDTYFKVAYMTRSYEDPMDFYKLCKAMKVDTSKIENNNKLSPPVKTFVGNEQHLQEVQTTINSILKEDLVGFATLKKADQKPRIDTIKEKLSSINFDCHYEMKQFNKETGTSVEAKPAPLDLVTYCKKYSVERGYACETDEEMFETFEDSLRGKMYEIVDTDSHRWYNLVEYITDVTVEGVTHYFKCYEYCTTGDLSWRDIDLEVPKLVEFVEVYPVKKEVTIFE